MSQPYIGEIRAFGFQFAPQNWAYCNGQPMNISDNPALFNIIGTTYGGDGVQTFNMPNLQGQVPMHWGTGPGGTTVIGQPQGVATMTLTQPQTPSHTHVLTAQKLPSGGVVERTQIPKAAVTSPIPRPAASGPILARRSPLSLQRTSSHPPAAPSRTATCSRIWR
jgi:microcystin-dependent protein